MNKLIIGGREFSSRLFVGTGKFSSNELMEKAIEASGSEMITVAMKRINMTQEATDDMLTHIDRNRVQFLPNTSGVRNAEEAVLAAQFSRECFGLRRWIKSNPLSSRAVINRFSCSMGCSSVMPIYFISRNPFVILRM